MKTKWLETVTKNLTQTQKMFIIENPQLYSKQVDIQLIFTTQELVILTKFQGCRTKTLNFLQYIGSIISWQSLDTYQDIINNIVHSALVATELRSVVHPQRIIARYLALTMWKETLAMFQRTVFWCFVAIKQCTKIQIYVQKFYGLFKELLSATLRNVDSVNKILG